jgi:MOSC domain-containing protein YiiM
MEGGPGDARRQSGTARRCSGGSFLRVATTLCASVYRLGQQPRCPYNRDVDARIEAVQVSRGGVPKIGVFETMVSEHGLDGDAQSDLRYHGGPDRAVVLYSLDVIRQLQAEGHPITPGATGENLTISGLDWMLVRPGTCLQVGDARLEVTRYATPCRKIGGSFRNADYMRISQDRHPGFSRVCARVLTGGLVRPGDSVSILAVDARGCK